MRNAILLALLGLLVLTLGVGGEPRRGVWAPKAAAMQESPAGALAANGVFEAANGVRIYDFGDGKLIAQSPSRDHAASLCAAAEFVAYAGYAHLRLISQDVTRARVSDLELPPHELILLQSADENMRSRRSDAPGRVLNYELDERASFKNYPIGEARALCAAARL